MRNGQIYPGQLRRLKETSVYKRARHDPLRGFFRKMRKHEVFKPLVVR